MKTNILVFVIIFNFIINLHPFSQTNRITNFPLKTGNSFIANEILFALIR